MITKARYISATFLNQVADILGDSENGLTGSQIVEYLRAHAFESNIKISYSEHPFPPSVPNKRTALRENLKVFPSNLQFKIIKELCDLHRFNNNDTVKNIKIKGEYSPTSSTYLSILKHCNTKDIK